MLPILFEQRMREFLGEKYEAFEQSFQREAYHSLRWNPLKRYEGMDHALFLVPETLNKEFHLSPVAWEEKGFYYEEGDAPGKHPYHDAGVYYIQEASAMLPVNLLRVEPGEYVLDLCAAPGGKSTQIAAALEGQGLLVSNEIHPARAKILSENIERMGVNNALVTNEAPSALTPYFPAFFDKILVDAPCSGEGMFRKNEEAVSQWSQENVELCAKRQREILDTAASMLAPGGRLVYSTCTFAPQENEENILWFLKTHPEFTAEEIPGSYYEMTGYPKEYTGMLRIYPHLTKGEGHFAAVLKKEGQRPERVLAQSFVKDTISEKKSKKKSPFAKEEWRAAYEEFCSSILTILPEDFFPNSGFVTFGDQLYLKPVGITNLTGLHILRPGLHLGTLKKGRFEPAHALALCLSGKEVRFFDSLDSKESTVTQYLNGQTYPKQGQKGWYLIQVDGFSLGWGKLAGGVMKNHYPKGLRY